LAILRIFLRRALDATELVALGILKCFFGRRRWQIPVLKAGYRVKRTWGG